MRLKKRTGERLELASAKANLWKKFREGGDDLSEREVAAWEGVRTSVMVLEEDGRCRNPDEEDEKIGCVTFVMNGGELLGGKVRDDVKVKGDTREREMMGDGLQDGCVLEGVQGQHGGRGNPMGEDKIRKRGLKRGYGEGGGMSPDGAKRNDQSDQSVSVSIVEEDLSQNCPLKTFKWGGRREQDQGGQVQGGEAILGGGGGTPLTEEEKVSSKVHVGGTVAGGDGGLTPHIIQEEDVDQSDQSVQGSDGGYGLLETITQKVKISNKSSGTFTFNKSTNMVRSRIAEIEQRDGVKEGELGFGFLRTMVGRDPSLSTESPSKRRKLGTQNQTEASSRASPARSSPSRRGSKPRRGPTRSTASRTTTPTSPPPRLTREQSSEPALGGGKGMDLSPARRCTGWLSTGGGTRGMNLVHHLPAKLQVEATSTLPPEMRPHILLFGNQGSGTSSSSPPGSSSSEKGSMTLDLDKGKLIQNNLAVKNMIEKIESGTEENIKKKEEKKKENQKKVRKNTEMKKN